MPSWFIKINELEAVTSYGTEKKSPLTDHDKTLHREHNYVEEHPVSFFKRPITEGTTRAVLKAASRVCGGKGEFFVL